MCGIPGHAALTNGIEAPGVFPFQKLARLEQGDGGWGGAGRVMNDVSEIGGGRSSGRPVLISFESLACVTHPPLVLRAMATPCLASLFPPVQVLNGSSC